MLSGGCHEIMLVHQNNIGNLEVVKIPSLSGGYHKVVIWLELEPRSRSKLSMSNPDIGHK